MNTSTKLQCLRGQNVPLPLPEPQLVRLAEMAQHRVIDRYQFLFLPDEPSEGIFFLIKGRIKIGTFAEDGREVIKEVMHVGTLLGELALSGEKKRMEYAQALHDEVEVLYVRVADFERLMHDNPRLVFAVMQYITQRLQRVEERLVRLVLQDARKRIIEFLVETAGRDGRRVGYETLIKHHLTQQDIANLTATSRQTVTSVFNDLKKMNLIHFNRNTILIRDMARLA